MHVPLFHPLVPLRFHIGRKPVQIRELGQLGDASRIGGKERVVAVEIVIDGGNVGGVAGEGSEVGKNTVGEYHIQIADLFMGNVIAQGDGHPGIPGQKIVLGCGAVQHERVVVSHGLGRFDGLDLDVLLFAVHDDSHEDKEQRDNRNGDNSCIV